MDGKIKSQIPLNRRITSLLLSELTQKSLLYFLPPFATNTISKS